MRVLLLLPMLMASHTMAATKPWLDDATHATNAVKVLGGNITVDNAVIVTTVTSQVPVQRSQALLGRYYTVTTPSKLSSTAESPILLFVNLSTNTNSVFFDIGEGNSLDNGVTTVFRAYTSPVVTSSGTALSILPTYPLAAASQMQAFLNPTISGNGTLVFTIATTSGRVVRELFQSRILTPGLKVLLTVEHSGNNKRSAVTLDWAEEAL